MSAGCCAISSTNAPLDVLQSLTLAVVTDDVNLALEAGFLDCAQRAVSHTVVAAEDQLQIGVGGQNALRGGVALINFPVCGLGCDDVQIVLAADAFDKALVAVNCVGLALNAGQDCVLVPDA